MVIFTVPGCSGFNLNQSNMRKHTLPVLFLFVSASGLYAQNKPKETYLSVKIVSEYNFIKEETYYSLVVDKGNTFAEDLYKLKTYRRKLRAEDSAYQFYTGGKIDTAKLYHNYFVSESAALSFMGAMDWKLLTINNSLSSGVRYYLEIPYSEILSVTNYYFKKEIY